MKVFHFLNEKYGLEALRRRRLKISRINDLNDPFEFFSVELSDRNLRRAFSAMKENLASNRGLHCFSEGWSNPVLWSHYADRHRGMCLGFDVPDEMLIPVQYIRERPHLSKNFLSWKPEAKEAKMKQLLATKFLHWSYEQERRCFASLETPETESDHYFSDFDGNFTLRQVVVGANSKVTRHELTEVLGSYSTTVQTFKARPAFKTFRIVRNNDKSLWC